MGAGYGYGHRVYVDQSRRPQRSGTGPVAASLKPATVEQCRLQNALNLERSSSVDVRTISNCWQVDLCKSMVTHTVTPGEYIMENGSWHDELLILSKGYAR